MFSRAHPNRLTRPPSKPAHAVGHSELNRGAASQREALETDLTAGLDSLTKAERRETALRDRYIEATDQAA